MEFPPPKTNPDWLSREKALTLVLISATAISFYICYRLASPFLPALTWALTLDVLAHPLHQRIARHVRRQSLAAALAIAVVALFVVAPVGFTTYRLIRQGTHLLEDLKSQTESGKWRLMIERNPNWEAALRWMESHVDVRTVTERAVNRAGTWLSSFIEDSLWSVVQILLAFFVLFFLFRDRHLLLRKVSSFIPLSPDETTRVISQVTDTIHATIYGTFVVALVQGLLGGLMFWWLGLSAPLLWGVLMGLLALIPILGAPVVWIPAAVYLATIGSWGKAVLLTSWGTIVIGFVDNLLYPVLVGNRLRMHTLVVLLSVLGGIVIFGGAGLILGPVAVVVTDALVELWKGHTSCSRAVASDIDKR